MLKLRLNCGYSKNSEGSVLVSAPHHIMDENLHPLVAVQWWSKPRDLLLLSSTEGTLP